MSINTTPNLFSSVKSKVSVSLSGQPKEAKESERFFWRGLSKQIGLGLSMHDYYTNTAINMQQHTERVLSIATYCIIGWMQERQNRWPQSVCTGSRNTIRQMEHLYLSSWATMKLLSYPPGETLRTGRLTFCGKAAWHWLTLADDSESPQKANCNSA